MNSHMVWLTRSTMEESVPLFPGKKPLLLWKISCVIYLFLVHPRPTLVSHPCPYLSAHPISHSFWRSMSCCDPDSTVQGSHSHKWGQDVSCGYLMRRWQPLLELLLYHAPMVGPLRSGFPLGCSRRLPLVAWHFVLPWSRSAEDRVIVGSISWQSGLSLFALGHFFILGIGQRLDMKWAGIAKSFGPTIAFQNATIAKNHQQKKLWLPKINFW